MAGGDVATDVQLMAGDWIKMRSNLWDDPRVSALCDACDCGEAQAIGALYWLWAAADQHSEAGMLVGMTARSIDRKTGLAGFASALQAIGWLILSEEGAQIVRFDEHNGASAKRRASESRRKMSARDADKERSNGGHEAQGVREESESDADNPQTCSGSSAHLDIDLEKDLTPPYSPPPPGGDTAADATESTGGPAGEKPKPRAKRESKPLQTLRTFREAGGLLVRVGDDPLLAYVDNVGLPEDYLRIAVHVFDQRFKPTEQKQRDWPAHFRNAVQSNWFKLWWADGETWRLTTAGKQAERELQALAEQQRGAA